MARTCKSCRQKITRRSGFVYCSNSCQMEHQHREYIKRWKAGKEKGTRGRALLLAKPLRRYLLDKMGNKCVACGWSQPHPTTGLPPLHIHHIDGNATNCRERNLTLLCPNCHALTPNFGSRNVIGRRCRAGLTKTKRQDGQR